MKFYATVLLFSLVWSSAFIAGRIAVVDIGAFTAIEVRMLISAVLLGAYALYKGQKLHDFAVMRAGMLLGLLNNAIYLGFMFSAMKYISPGWAAIMAACAPFITTALSRAFGLEILNLRKLSGIAVGFFGVVIMTGVNSLKPDAIWGLLLAVLAVTAFSLGTVLFRGKTAGMEIVPLNFWSSASGALFTFPFALLSGRTPLDMTLSGALAVAWLVVVTILGMALWFLLIRMRGASTASSYHLLNPVFGLLLSLVILGIPIHWYELAGAFFIGVGLFITSRAGGSA